MPDGPGAGGPRAGLAVPAGAGRGARRGVDSRAGAPDRAARRAGRAPPGRCLLEVLTGGVLGWSAALIVAGARLAGELVAAQAGLSTATLLDPETGEEMTVLGPALRLDRAGRVSGAGWPAGPGPGAGRELSGRTGRRGS